MTRTILVCIAVLAATAVFASDLWAHGGQFRGPGGAVPPGMREPSDPTPPPPPPPSGPPTTPSTPTTPGSGPAMPSTPQPVGPTTPAPATPATGPTKPKGPASLGFENWVFWYHNNKEDIENLKEALYSNVSSESVIWDLGGRRRSNKSDSMHDIRALVESDIIPALIWAMDPKNSGHQDTESAAYIALAKMAKDPVHIESIQKGLDKQLKRDLITQESSALALGLLRRADEENQFTAADLDKVRNFLFDVFDDDDYQARTRGFAALALGLLGDQPTGSKDYIEGASNTAEVSDTLAAKMQTTTRLFERLKAKYSNQDLYIGLLMAIGLQDPKSITEAQRDVLRDCVMKGKLYNDDASRLVRSYATLQLGRIGTSKDVGVLQRILVARRNNDVNIQRSAAIGLGTLGNLIPSNERVNVANGLLEAIEKKKVKDASAVNFSYISLAYLIIEDIKARKTDVIDQTKATQFLITEAEKGRYIQRPFAALSLALMGREIGEEGADVKAYGDLRQKSLDVLRNGLGSKKLDKRGRAAFACALGIIRDDKSARALEEIVADTKEDHELRGYAALGLGLTGYAPKSAKAAIRSALKERRSEEMRQQCATALGLLKDTEAMEILLEELKNATSQSVKGQVVLAMAKIGTEDSVEPLIKLLKNDSKREQDLTRALACAGLGVIGDLELIPSLSRISKNVNYRGSTDLINEVLSII